MRFISFFGGLWIGNYINAINRTDFDACGVIIKSGTLCTKIIKYLVVVDAHIDGVIRALRHAHITIYTSTSNKRHHYFYSTFFNNIAKRKFVFKGSFTFT